MLRHNYCVSSPATGFSSGHTRSPKAPSTAAPGDRSADAHLRASLPDTDLTAGPGPSACSLHHGVTCPAEGTCGAHSTPVEKLPLEAIKTNTSLPGDCLSTSDVFLLKVKSNFGAGWGGRLGSSWPVADGRGVGAGAGAPRFTAPRLIVLHRCRLTLQLEGQTPPQQKGSGSLHCSARFTAVVWTGSTTPPRTRTQRTEL